MKYGRFDIEDDGQFQELLQNSDYVPPAPDLRAAITNAISQPSKKRTWLYGFALAPLAAVLLVMFLMCRPVTHDNDMALAPRSTEKRSVSKPVDLPDAPKLESNEQAEPKKSTDVRHSEPKVSVQPKPAPVPRRMVPKKKIRLIEHSKPLHRLQAKVEEKARELLKADVQPACSDSVAIVAVSNEPPSDDYSYSCTQRDSVTGEVTRSAGSRSGNCVMVYVEVEPGG
jgi:outer membrane biosynthesis protein TonB